MVGQCDGCGFVAMVMHNPYPLIALGIQKHEMIVFFRINFSLQSGRTDVQPTILSSTGLQRSLVLFAKFFVMRW